MSLLKIISLTAGYGKNIVITNIFVNVNEGEIVAILGPNGSGKSTLLKSVMGITKVFSGKIFFKDVDLTPLSVDRRARVGIGYVPQLDNVFTELSVEENLEMGAYTRPKREEVRLDIEDIYSLFPSLRGKRKRKAKTLSGGERQMLAIARALMAKPKLLILDEPTSSLAPNMVSTLVSKIKEVNSRGVSVLMAEQNVKVALEIADRVYIMRSGRVIFEGPSNSLTGAMIGDLFLTKKATQRTDPEEG